MLNFSAVEHPGIQVTCKEFTEALHHDESVYFMTFPAGIKCFADFNAAAL